jgi:hypothetical protein
MLLNRTGWLAKEMMLHRMRVPRLMWRLKVMFLDCANGFEKLNNQGKVVEVFDSLLKKATK